MASPLTLPIARLRAAGCKVGHVVGHDPITTGSHPRGTSRWQFSVTPPEPVKDIVERLFRWDNSWATDIGQAYTYHARDGRIIVQAFAQPLPDPLASSRELREHRQRVESDVATLLGRIATVISNGRI